LNGRIGGTCRCVGIVSVATNSVLTSGMKCECDLLIEDESAETSHGCLCLCTVTIFFFSYFIRAVSGKVMSYSVLYSIHREEYFMR
jgi:hypothetical protein